MVANNIRNNSFFVSMDYGASIAWHTALGAKNTWMWDQVMDKNDPNSVSFYLDAGTHTLVIKQMEDGTKLDSILITTQPGWIRETVYCDAENGGTEGWDVFDATPAGALITNVFDEDRGRPCDPDVRLQERQWLPAAFGKSQQLGQREASL